MVLVELDSNTILAGGMRDRTLGEMIQACQVMVDQLKKTEFETKMHILNKQRSVDFKEIILQSDMEYHSEITLCQFCVGQT